MAHALNTLLGWPGAFLIQRIEYLINLVTFISFVLYDWLSSIRLFNRQSYRPVVTQIIFSGIDALPTIIFLSLITGFILTFRMIALFDSSGDILALLNYVIALEVGPIMAAITLISRTGTAITVDIGNMKLHKEIQSLELLGVDINEFLIAPRILGVAVAQLSIAVFFTLITLSSGIILSGLLVSPTHFGYLLKLADHIEPLMLLIFISKNILFGLVIGSIACFHGLRVGDSATEVPQQTQKAVVNILIMLFIIDGIIAMVLI